MAIGVSEWEKNWVSKQRWLILLLALVPNSAGFESSFSNTGVTSGKLRNQIEAKNADNLQFFTAN